MRKQHKLCRVNEEKKTNIAFKNRENAVTSSNISETQKPTPQHGNFLNANGLILLHTRSGKINLL